MRPRLFLFALLAAAPELLFAATPSAAPADLTLSMGHDGHTVALHVHETTVVDLHLSNVSDRPITVTHLSAGLPAFFVPITPVIIPPKGSGIVSITIDGRHLHLPLTTQFSFYVTVDGVVLARSYAVILTSPELFLYQPRFLLWRVGESATPRKVHVTNIPAGVDLTGVACTNGSFTASYDPTSRIVTVTPVATNAAANAEIVLQASSSTPPRAVIEAIVAQGPPPTAATAPPVFVPNPSHSQSTAAQPNTPSSGTGVISSSHNASTTH